MTTAEDGILGVACTRCFWCGKEGELLINTLLTTAMKKKVEDCHNKVINKDPCHACTELLKERVLFVELDEKLTKDFDNPENWYRTGRICWINRTTIPRIFKDYAQDILKEGIAICGKEDGLMNKLQETCSIANKRRRSKQNENANRPKRKPPVKVKEVKSANRLPKKLNNIKSKETLK